MKSIIKLSAISILGVVSASAATLTFTNTGLAVPIVASGFGDAGGNIASGLIWGVVVDRNGNGFAAGNWNSGITLTAGNTTGIQLQATTGGATDDVLYINGTVTSNLSSATDSAAAGTGRVNSISTVTFGSLLTGGESFGIIWFDRGIALGSTPAGGAKYGFISSGTLAAPPFVLPLSNASAQDYSAAFLGADPAKSASFVLGVPEPSAALLSAVGVLGLLRRRRN